MAISSALKFHCHYCGMPEGELHLPHCATHSVKQQLELKAAPPKVLNPSGLHPAGLAVLVEPYEPEIKRSQLVMPDNVKERTAMVEIRARVIEVGPEAWRDERQPRAAPGDIVFITRYAGILAKGIRDGKWYRLINDADVFCKCDEIEEVANG